MMRSLLLIGCFLLALSACKKRADVLLTGEIEGLSQSEIMLYGFRPDSTESIRKVAVRQGSFACTLLPDSVWPVVLIFDGVLEVPVFANRGDEVTIKGDVKNPSAFLVEGGEEINRELNAWRQGKETSENFIKKYPDHPASAWMILSEALSKPTMETAHLKQLLSLVTPRIAESSMLSPLKKELERQFSNHLEIPYFSKGARSILRADNEKIDSVFTHEQLKNRINTLLNHK